MQFSNQSKQEYPDSYRSSGQNQKSSSSLELLGDPIALGLALLEKWWVFFLTTALCLSLGFAYLYYSTPEYRSTCRIEVVRDTRVATRTLTEFERLDFSVQRHALLLESRRLNNTVRNNLEEKWKSKLSYDQRYVSLKVESIRESRGTMLDLSVESIDPDYASDYLDEMVKVYEEIHVNELDEIDNYAISGLKLEEERVLEDLEEAKHALQEFEAENKVSLAQQREQADTQMLNQLVSKLKNLKMEKALVESQFEGLLDKDVATIREALLLTRETMSLNSGPSASSEMEGAQLFSGQFSSDSASTIARDETDTQSIIDWEKQLEILSSLEEEYENKKSVFKETHPRMVELNSQIDSLRKNLEDKAEISIKRFKAYYDALIMQESGLEKAIEEWENEQSVSVQLVNKYNQLNSRVEFLEKKYETVYSRILENSDNTDIFFVRLVEPITSSYPRTVKPDRVKILAASGAGGLAMGAGLVLIALIMKPSILSYEEIEEDYHIPYFTGIPQWDLVLKKREFNPGKDKLVVARDKNKSAIETYRSIRSKINIQFKEKQNWVLALTSTRKGDGKTFNCANIAQLFSWDSAKVALLDADFRKGSLTRLLLEKNAETGLSDWFKQPESTDLDNLKVTFDEYGFDLYPAGNFTEDLPELVKERRLRELFDKLKESYDLVIVDTAPATMVVETSTICQCADGTMIIASENTPKRDFRYLIRELHNVRIVGFCINRLSPPKKGVFSYGDHSNKYYHYGYGQTYSSDKTSA